jgi:surface antigen
MLRDGRAMTRPFLKAVTAAALLATGTGASFVPAAPVSARELPAYLQCVPFAREVSGIRIFGDAHTWWKQAADRYRRGNRPEVGAVMAFRPHRNMQLGHVAAVAKVIDARTVLLDHANWSPINGRRGQIERGVRAIDVSPGNDWSQVRVWYHPLQALGKTRWPVHGFIYADEPEGGAAPNRSFPPVTRTAAANKPATEWAAEREAGAPSKAFAGAFANLAVRGEGKAKGKNAKKPVKLAARAAWNVRTAPTTEQAPSDPFAQVIARYE